MRDLDDDDSWLVFDKIYRPMLTGYAIRRGLTRDEADEIAQQCLTAVAERIGKFQRERSFRGWLRGMVNHKVSDYLAYRVKHRQMESGVLDAAEADAPGAAEIWQKQWNAAHLRYLLDSLKDDFARHTLQAFVLYVFYELPVEEISDALDMTPNQIYVAKSRVLTALRKRHGNYVDTLYEK